MGPKLGDGFYLKAKLLKDEGLSLKHLQEERARCAEVEAGWIAEAEKRKHCHPECVDGYCHRAYMNGIILAKEV